MIIPIRCVSCGKPLGHLWEDFQKRLKAGETQKEIFDDMGLERYCCRTTLMGHLDLADVASEFKKH